MAQNRSDNIQLNANKILDNRSGILDGGIWRPYDDLDEFHARFPDLTGLPENLTFYVRSSIKHEQSDVYLLGRDKVPYIQTAGGGGGGAGGIVFRFKTISELNPVFVNGDPNASVSFNFTSLDTTDNDTPTGNGTLVIKSGALLLYTGSVAQGDTVFNISSFLKPGTNTLDFTITDSYGNYRTVQYQVNSILLSISTSYNVATINSGGITFRYTPIGTIEKTVHFKLDEIELAPVVTTDSGNQLTYNISAQNHGVHVLEVWMTAVITGQTVQSNKLIVNLLCIEAGNTETLVAIDFQLSQIEQYITYPIKYCVYDPESLTALVDLKVNGTTVSAVIADRNEHIWNYRPNTTGLQILSIESNESSRSVSVTVIPSRIDVQPVTQDLDLYLTSQNRSNQEINRSEWKFGAIESTLTGFNWVSNGWVVDGQGSTALRLSNGASVNVPIQPFGTEIRNSGKTIEFEISVQDIKDYTATVISCLFGGIGFKITPNTLEFSSELSNMETFFKEEERIRIALVINKLNDARLMYLYINGIRSAAARYPSLDNFIQTTPQNITLTSTQATINVYTIRIYNNNLNQNQLLNNYIADLDNIDKKIDLVQRNNIFDGLGLVSLDKCLNFLPCLIITGELPTVKGQKKQILCEYINRQDTTKSFTSTGEADVQGTSSQYYPRKNIKIKHGPFTTSTGTASKYAIRDGSIPERTFTYKTDFAESSGTHNTGFAKMVDYLQRSLNILTPPMTSNPKVRTVVDGFPILIFNKTTPEATPQFIGKYNFNNDKGNTDTFGFTSGTECWEYLNNTSDICLFKGADFESVDGEGKPVWKSDLEARYPEDSEDITNIKALTEWVVSCIGNPTKFKNEASTYFNIPNLVFYYCMTEAFACVDQRGKNMMMAFFGGKAYPIFYDNDTILGINNEGIIKFFYDVEYHDIVGGGNAWNAESSTLWNLVEQAFQPEIATMWANIRNVLPLSKVLEFMNTQQSDKWSAAIYNEDSYYKYVLPLLQSNEDYLEAAQGSREEHRNWWLFNRLRYIDSKYRAGTFLADYAVMRLYTPSGSLVIAANADFLLTAFSPGYGQVKFGSYPVNGELITNNTKLFKAPNITFNDTETIIYGSSFLKSLGSLAAKYIGTLDVSRAVKLIELPIGSTTSGYINNNLIAVSVGNNKLLETINVSNCKALNTTLELGGCPAMKSVYAKGSSITGVTIARGAPITTLHLPAVASLVLKDLLLLQNSGLEIEGYINLKTLIVENCPLFDVGAVIDKFIFVNRIRLINVDAVSDYSSDLYYFSLAQGVDEQGNTTPNAVITGSWHFTNAYQEDLDEYATKFPELAITYDNLLTEVAFASETIKNALEAEFGTLTLATIRSITDMNECFDGIFIEEEETFDEFRYFTGITSIGYNDIPRCDAPDNVQGFTSIVLPLSLRTLEDGCGLVAKTILGLEGITHIGTDAFSDSANSECFGDMTTVNFTNVSVLNTRAFRNLHTGVTFDFTGSSFDTVPVECFYNMLGSFRLVLPNSIKYVETDAFAFDGAVSAYNWISYPNSIVSVKARGLTAYSSDSITLPTNLQNVYTYGLSYITAPTLIFKQNVQYIENIAIRQGDVVNIILLGLIPPSIQADAFYTPQVETWTDRKIYVPDFAYEDYKTATNWSWYFDEGKLLPMSDYTP